MLNLYYEQCSHGKISLSNIFSNAVRCNQRKLGLPINQCWSKNVFEIVLSTFEFSLILLWGVLIKGSVQDGSINVNTYQIEEIFHSNKLKIEKHNYYNTFTN